MTYDASGAAAIVALVLSLLISRPLALRVGQLEASLRTAPEPSREDLAAEIAVLRRCGTLTGTIPMILLVLGAAGTAVARILP